MLKAPAESSENLLLKRRVLKRAPWYEVKRDSDICYVGDLNGSLRAFRKNLSSARVINEKNDWIGENKIVVFVGDIIADRNTEGLEILLEIHKLRIQAKAAGGDLILIAGNHDDYALSFLRDAPSPFLLNPLGLSFIENNGMGITEFTRYLSKKTVLLNNEAEYFALLKKRKPEKLMTKFHVPSLTYAPQILKNMKKDPTGRKILETMCSYNVCFQLDDTLAQHCPLNSQMVELIELHGIDGLNSIYQKVLQKDLLGEKQKISKDEMLIFEQIRISFLYTENRAYIYDENIDFTLSERGINLNIHGHNPQGGLVYQIGPNISAANIDYGAFYCPEYDENSELRSLATVDAVSGQVIMGNPYYTEHVLRTEKTEIGFLRDETTKKLISVDNIDKTV